MFEVIATLLALVGSLIQARLAVQTLRAAEKDAVRTFAIVDDWHQEVSWWRPFRKLANRKLIGQLMAESPSEAAVYRRVRDNLIGWVVLLTGAGVALAVGVAKAMSGFL